MVLLPDADDDVADWDDGTAKEVGEAGPCGEKVAVDDDDDGGAKVVGVPLCTTVESWER